ncbi:FixH family protein [Metabacillus idriensis]|uniref:FixH family protein n=1 Tax=Metabacillus idriensis TaxID=324768 RepID=UPI003D27FE31
MKRILSALFLLTCVLFSAACASESGDKTAEGSLMVNADIRLPAEISRNKEETISVAVTQGDEAVDDASDVQFEIWKAGSKDDSEMIKAVHKGKGIYEIKKTFSEDGPYFVQTHVTARDLHVMPKKEFTVGKAAEEESVKADEHEKEENTGDDHSHH